MNRYQEAGVDVNVGYQLVKKIRADVNATRRPGMVGGIGGFGGMFDLGQLNYRHPVLVAGTDGVGTKLLVAQKVGRHDTVGIDAVAMCVNDLLAQGAEPLYFLDYIAAGHNDPDRLASVVHGVSVGCRQAGAALVGGETAEMPEMYDRDEYDLAGFATGIAERDQILDGTRPQEGDILIGLASAGLHSNGFSLVRQILFHDHDVDWRETPAILQGQTVGQTLLTPTRIYVQTVLPLVHAGLIEGISHITGGGLIENLPRMFADNLQAVVSRGTWPILPVFKYLARLGQLADDDLWGTFNMGLGLVLAVHPANVDRVTTALQEAGEAVYQVGHLKKRPLAEEKVLIK
ncbi:phosphoribosylformylglycinamidine cyclo-ligase [uncultured Limosilactobacillus sp.]|uniref:phosphoribosylformylglycinamidine cyclo-ligase n=1 Tax=uncultured Limosilactobacillus sp. TaxID=2837629 RepID=UPI0025D9A162|nr:phosphoribosylformylglycinamidine cyclo-ligase [uncultured Limosilactobacillus sp.]